jgi:hypothetical protein
VQWFQKKYFFFKNFTDGQVPRDGKSSPDPKNRHKTATINIQYYFIVPKETIFFYLDL